MKKQIAYLCLGRDSFLFFWGPLLGANSEMSCPRRCTCWQSKRLYWEGAPGRRAGRSGNPELLCLVACSLGVYGDGVSFRVVSGQLLRLACGLTRGPSWWCISRKEREGLWVVGCWEVGRLLALLAPPDFSRLVFGCNTTFFIETTQAGRPGQGRWFQSTVP